jgi:hypothetical protein
MPQAARQQSAEMVLDLLVCEIYRSFRNAYAEDGQGRRFLVNEASGGVDFERLELGQRLHAHVSPRNYVMSVDR